MVRQKTGEVPYEKLSMSPRPQPKVSLRHEWTREFCSKVVRQPEGEAVRPPEGEVVRLKQVFPINPTDSRSNS